MKRRQRGILTGMPFMANLADQTFIDDLGRRVYLSKPPRRVVSLAPSVTEILFAVGLDAEVVGVTTFCDYPAQAKTRPKIGAAIPNLEAILGLKPDLVVAGDNMRPDVLAKLEQLKIPVFVLFAIFVFTAYAATGGKTTPTPTPANNLGRCVRSAGDSTVAERGLMFVCFQTSIQDQFEFVTRWMNSPDFKDRTLDDGTLQTGAFP